MWNKITLICVLVACMLNGCMDMSPHAENTIETDLGGRRDLGNSQVEEGAMSPNSTYMAAIDQPNRSAADVARDASSMPAHVLALMQVQPGQTVLDFQAGAGYFSELLAYMVGENGKVYAHNHSREGLLTTEVFEQRYGNNRLPNTEQLFPRHNDLDMPSGSLDAVLMSMVYHDTYWYDGGVAWGPVDHQAFLAELHDALRPEGVILVIDHQAEDGADPYESAKTTHRIDRSIVLRDFAEAGFVIEAESNLLRNSDDSYAVQIFNDDVYRDTDRFMLLFKKSH